MPCIPLPSLRGVQIFQGREVQRRRTTWCACAATAPHGGRRRCLLRLLVSLCLLSRPKQLTHLSVELAVGLLFFLLLLLGNLVGLGIRLIRQVRLAIRLLLRLVAGVLSICS